MYGDLPYHEGDYLVIHRGIMHRYRLDLSGEQTKLLIMESRGHVRWPKRYRNEFGQLIEGAPYSERDIRRPTQLRTHDEKGRFPRPGQAVRRSERDHPRSPSIRRGGLGRILLSLGLQHQRLRTDRGTGAPAASGPSDVPGRWVRGLQLLPAALRFPPGGGASPVQSQQRRFRRSALLRLERVHEPERASNSAASRITRTGFPMALIPVGPRQASGPNTPRSWRS